MDQKPHHFRIERATRSGRGRSHRGLSKQAGVVMEVQAEVLLRPCISDSWSWWQPISACSAVLTNMMDKLLSQILGDRMSLEAYDLPNFEAN